MEEYPGDYGENPDPKEEEYERLLAESVFHENRLERLALNEPLPKKKGRKRSVNPETYAQFYVEGIKLSPNKDKDAEEKEKLLTGYFRRKFIRRGKSTLAGMDKYKLGSLFNHMMDYAK